MRRLGSCVERYHLFCAESDPPQSVYQRARTLSAPIFQLGREFGFEKDVDELWHWWGKDSSGKPLRMDALRAPTLNSNQAAAAVQALALLEENVDISVVGRAIARATLPGRLEVIPGLANGPEIILDVAHNPAAARALAENLRLRTPRTGGEGRHIAGLIGR